MGMERLRVSAEEGEVESVGEIWEWSEQVIAHQPADAGRHAVGECRVQGEEMQMKQVVVHPPERGDRTVKKPNERRQTSNGEAVPHREPRPAHGRCTARGRISSCRTLSHGL